MSSHKPKLLCLQYDVPSSGNLIENLGVTVACITFLKVFLLSVEECVKWSESIRVGLVQ